MSCHRATSLGSSGKSSGEQRKMSSRCVLSTNVQHRLQGYIQRKLKSSVQTRNDKRKEQREGDNGSNATSRQDEKRYVERVHEALNVLLHAVNTVDTAVTTVAATSAVQSSNTNVHPGISTLTKSASVPVLSSDFGQMSDDQVERMINSFLDSVFPQKDSLAYKTRCPYCGLIFTRSNTTNTVTEQE
uniref:Uncharacterized protein n=1 Tax=Lygus hesperus TaxID=30085 RepID=A0A146M945_LYGHE